MNDHTPVSGIKKVGLRYHTGETHRVKLSSRAFLTPARNRIFGPIAKMEHFHKNSKRPVRMTAFILISKLQSWIPLQLVKLGKTTGRYVYEVNDGRMVFVHLLTHWTELLDREQLFMPLPTVFFGVLHPELSNKNWTQKLSSFGLPHQIYPNETMRESVIERGKTRFKHKIKKMRNASPNYRNP